MIMKMRQYKELYKKVYIKIKINNNNQKRIINLMKMKNYKK